MPLSVVRRDPAVILAQSRRVMAKCEAVRQRTLTACERSREIARISRSFLIPQSVESQALMLVTEAARQHRLAGPETGAAIRRVASAVARDLHRDLAAGARLASPERDR